VGPVLYVMNVILPSPASVVLFPCVSFSPNLLLVRTEETTSLHYSPLFLYHTLSHLVTPLLSCSISLNSSHLSFSWFVGSLVMSSSSPFFQSNNRERYGGKHTHTQTHNDAVPYRTTRNHHSEQSSIWFKTLPPSPIYLLLLLSTIYYCTTPSTFSTIHNNTAFNNNTTNTPHTYI
jgi:hypothetical protein